MVLDKRAAVPVRRQPGTQRQAFVRECRQFERRLAVEAQKFEKHAPETRTDQVAALGKQPVQIGRGIFHIAIAQRDRERHVRGRGRHAEVTEQRGQVGVGRLVKDDEPGIDGNRAIGSRYHYRIGVAADPVRLLVNGDAMGAGQ